MRRTAPALAALTLLALTGCSDGTPDASPTSAPATTPSSTAPTSAPATSATTPASTWPAGCASPAPAPAGAVVAAATVTGKTVTTAKHEYTAKIGGQFRVMVTADVADEVHVHSYDRKADTKPGCPTVIDVKASIPGSVEVELEDAGLHLFDLKAQ